MSGWGFDVGTSPGDDLLAAPLPDQLRSEPEAKPSLFVAMPFTPRSDELFHYVIQKVAHDSGFRCERIDHAAYTGDVLAQIKERIAGADLVIAELSETNANVYLEIGFAWGRSARRSSCCTSARSPSSTSPGRSSCATGT